MSALRRGIVALAAVVIAPITARAADLLPVIRVLPPQCEATPLSIDDFVDSLRVELAGRQPHCCVVGPGSDALPDAARVTLSIEPCDAATEQVGVTIDLTDPPRTVERQVSLADLPPEARGRALALAVAELIRSAGGPAQPDAAAAIVPREQPPEPPPPQLAVSGNVAGEFRRHTSTNTNLWGARLGISLSSSRWQATIDAGAAASRSDVSLGEVSILEGSAGLFAGPRFLLGPVIASAGPTATLGWAQIVGRSTISGVTPGSGWGLVSTAGARAAVEGPASSTIRVFGYLEGGYTVRRLDAIAADQQVAGISGPYLTLAIGVKLGPS
jgi:hypothetical protein